MFRGVKIICTILFFVVAFLNGTSCSEADVVLVRDGQALATIVVGKEASEAEKYAAEELRSHLAKISGCDILCEEGVKLETSMILVGWSKALEEVESGVDFESMSDEELLIRTKGPHLILAGGRPRGTLYAVYEFLEKYLGCRWYTKDVSRIPKQSTIRLKEIDYRYNPPFMYREALYYEAHDVTFAARQRLNGGYNRRVRAELPGGAVAIEPFGHTFAQLVPPHRYFKEHPEYYSLVDGERVSDKQLCLSNPQVLKIATEKVLDWAQGMPKGVIISVSQNDGYGACECEKCQAIVKEGGTEMEPILRFVNAIAAEVAKEYPDRYIETLSYAYSETPPRDTKARDNVIIRLCHWYPGCNVHGVATCPTNKVWREEIDGWKDKAKNIFIWDYMVTFHKLMEPFPNWWAIGEDSRYYAQQGIDGVFWQGNHRCPGTEMSDLRTYVTAQMLWHPHRDVDKVINDFLYGFYGSAARPIRKYMEMLHEHVVKENICRNRRPVELTPEMVVNSKKLFDLAEELAANESIRNRVKKARAGIQHVKLSEPEKYHLDKEKAYKLFEAYKETVQREGITIYRGHHKMEEWLKECDKRLKETYK